MPVVWASTRAMKRGEHDQVAMGDVDQPHDPEDQRQPGREQRVEAAQQNALHDALSQSTAQSPK